MYKPNRPAFSTKALTKAHKIIIGPAKTIDINGGAAKFTSSDVTILNDKGEECDLYITPPKQSCFGVNAAWDATMPKDKQNDDNIKNYQIAYSATTMQTINNPTKNEKDWISSCDLLRKAIANFYKKGEGIEDIPRSACMFLDKGLDGVKPLYSYSTILDPSDKKKKKKIPDMSKPAKTYCKLQDHKDKVTKKIDKITTECYGPGDKKVPALKYLDTPGIVEPCIHVKSVYWGTHGENPYGGSAQLAIDQFNFTPNRGAVKQKLLPRNEAPEEDDEDTENREEKNSEPDSSEENDDFQSGADNSKINKLKNVVKKKLNRPVPPPASSESEGEPGEGDKDFEEENTPPKPAPKAKVVVKTPAKVAVKPAVKSDLVPKKVVKKPPPKPVSEDESEDVEE